MSNDQPIIVTTEDYSIHRDTPFCYDLSCPCHGNSDNLATLHKQWRDGLVTTKELSQILRGKVV